jgi:hypothetical protein
MSFLSRKKKDIDQGRSRSQSEPVLPNFSPRDTVNIYKEQIEHGTQKKVNITRHRSGSYTLTTEDGLKVNVFITN